MDSKQFAQGVLRWFDRYGRHDLPWQKKLTPYRVWVSEIMLQQTQVSTVIPYFERFIKRFPTVGALALAPLDEILAHWSGLGYYARARNLHRAAQIIHVTYHGRFPSTVETLSSLPGIGRSTAGAVLSLGMHQYAVILDGNVKRVLARYNALDVPINQQVGINILWSLAEKYTPKNRCWDYNQAMMDIGAMICTRTKPKCSLCPLKSSCKAHRLSQQMNFPIKKAKTARAQKAAYLLLLRNSRGEILLEKRPPTGIWGGLWSFPQCPIEEDIDKWCQTKLGFEAVICERWNSIFHQFSHFEFEIKPVLLQIETRQPRMMECPPQIWDKEHSALPGGIAAPVARLLKQLTQQTAVL
ncbi:A/G-specific adenine glycosylase [Coxiella burnetii]|uniref:A/G-specific adenine glycosylase n=1 Tax=Coxiella burnetii TaxID=777 RepID=UPI0021ADA829|nr:A/G-specific adenine glycosylase [Coxiella burnetii]